jgi:hypothetical protein
MPHSSGERKIILGGRRLVVEQNERTSGEPNCATVDSLQFSRAFHRAEVAPNRLLSDAQSIRNVDDVHTTIGGQQIGDRLIAGRGLRVLDGHTAACQPGGVGKITDTHLVAVDRISAKDL